VVDEVKQAILEAIFPIVNTHTSPNTVHAPLEDIQYLSRPGQMTINLRQNPWRNNLGT
jgi:hypothetical protein